MKKYVVLVASVIMQICLGGVYAWGTFIDPLVGDYGLTISQTQLIYGLTFPAFTITMIFAGKFMLSHGPRFTATIGSILLAVGYLVASMSQGSFLLLVLGISLLAGMGLGFGYICPLATSVKWFPNHQGLITGFSVAGFGLGAIVLSSVVNIFLESGTDVLLVFRWIGLVYGLIILIMAQLLFSPPDIMKDGKSEVQQNIMHIINSKKFRRLAGGIFCGTMAGILINGNLSPLASTAGLDNNAIVLGIGAFAVGNGVGRITWGYFYDRFGNAVLAVSQVLLALSILSLILVLNTSWTFAIAAGLIGFGFAANFVIYVAEVSNSYGTNNVGTIYPYIFLFYGLAGMIGPWVGGVLFEMAGTYLPSIILAAIIALIGAFL